LWPRACQWGGGQPNNLEALRLMREVRFLRSSFAFVLLVGMFVIFGPARPSAAATLTVCASGCAYTDLQDAIDDSQPGDTILLRAGETFIGNFVLRNKPNSTGAYITIKSDAPATALPPAGTRLVPPGRTGANVTASSLARLRGQGGHYKAIPVLQAAVGAHHYRLQFLDIDGIAQEGWYTLLSFGTNGSSQTTLASVPHNIIVDRVYVHGDRTKGQKRCITLNGRSIEVLNSYVSECGSFDADAQAIIGYNGPGPFKIINNYLEGTGETIMFGGADPVITNLVPSDIEIRSNHITKPLSWRNPILTTPSAAPSASVVAGGGSLGAGNHYFKVVALVDAQNTVALSAPSAERSVAVSASGAAVRLTWNGVSGATRYRIYRGTSAGAENRYLQTTSAVTSFTYTGASETTGTPPTAGTKWVIKNLIELKNAQRVTIDGNVIEQVWAAAQGGFAVVLSPRNQDGSAPWSVVRDITISNNIIRHAGNGIAVTGHDTNHPSGQTQRVTVRNNLVYDIGSAWGAVGRFLTVRLSPSDVVLDHNTLFHERAIVLVEDGTSSGFRMTNNIAPHGPQGLFGTSAGSGSTAIAKYFPGGVVTANALGGGDPTKYPAGNLFPDMQTFLAQFVDAAAWDYRLISLSMFRSKATDGKNLGVDFTALQAAQGNNSTITPLPPPPSTAGPYGGTPVSLPGTLQAENFDEGPAGVVYVDSTPGNRGGKYRNGDVDIEVTGDTGGGYNVGWMTPGEWLNYTVNVGAAGTYDIEFRVASSGGGGSFHLEVGGTNKTGAVAIPNTGGWYTWATVRKTGMSLAAGKQVLRFVLDQAGASGATMNLNHIKVIAAGGSPTPPPPPTSTPSDIVLYASDVSRVAGNWARVPFASGAGGQTLQSADRGWSTPDVPKAAPADYFEVPFTPMANTAYRLWIRLRGQNNSKWNESVWVQFSGAVNSSGAPLWPVGSTSALLVNLENCSGCGVSAWGWQDNAYWKSNQAIVRFATATQQTIRIQTREDGAQIDQIVLSPVNYFSKAPGALKNDSTIVSKSAPLDPPSTASDILLRSADVTRLAGNWARQSSTTAAGGEKVASIDRGWSSTDVPIAAPANYLEMQFTPEAGRAYRVWLRLRAANNSKWNDSVWVQFSGAVTSSGAALWRTGTTSALLVNLEDCSACGVSEWGWQDSAWWLQQAAVVRFASATTQTIRVQTREDGVEIDQIVLSPVTFFDNPPGAVKQDGTIVPR
jgi:hypothetical protein